MANQKLKSEYSYHMAKLILKGICEEKKNSEICKQYDIQESTVNVYISLMKKEYNIKTRVGLVIYAIKNKIYNL